MTTLWHPNGEWAGATVAVLGAGPSLTADAVEALQVDRIVAVNFACRLAPEADMLVALDGNWPQELREFAGLRVTGVEDPELDALYVGPRWERVQLAPGHEVEIHNSGLAAIRIAAQMGAQRIMLFGFDHPGRRGHFYDDVEHEYFGLAEGLAQIAAELTARGVTVERIGG